MVPSSPRKELESFLLYYAELTAIENEDPRGLRRPAVVTILLCPPLSYFTRKGEDRKQCVENIKPRHQAPTGSSKGRNSSPITLQRYTILTKNGERKTGKKKSVGK